MNWTNEKLGLNSKELNEVLKIILDLKRQIVGIRFLFTEKDYEISTANSKTGTIAYCTAVKNATQGQSVKLKEENFACMAAAMAMGILKPSDQFISGDRNSKLGLYRDLTVSRQVSRNMVFCEHNAYGVEIRPLEQYVDYEPNVVIVVTYPYNLMRIVQGHAYMYGHMQGLHMGGMNAICQELTSYVHEKNEINVSALCSGTRALAQWDDSELGIGIPFNKLKDIVEGILMTINVMDKNKHKKIIQEKLKGSEVLKDFEVKLNFNYYRGVYRTPKDVR